MPTWTQLKCPQCIDEGQIKAKHVSFDQFLHDIKSKCSGQHPQNGRCNSCLPSSMISYQLKPDCNKHAPYPKAMCNNCLPPSILLKRQEYRHVDYVEFLNFPEMSNFVQYWTSQDKTKQGMGFLYGYYAEDPIYQKGVRAIVEAIYEPPQKGTFGHVDLLQDPDQSHADEIAANLGMERSGGNIECESGLLHNTNKFILLNTQKVVQQANSQLLCQEVRLLTRPSFVYNGKAVKEFEPDFLIVNVAHGYNPNSRYSILKLYDFPVENRSAAVKQQDLKNFFQKHEKKPSYHRFADFHLLLYLSNLIDIQVNILLKQNRVLLIQSSLQPANVKQGINYLML